jgi:hypothetical protein
MTFRSTAESGLNVLNRESDERLIAPGDGDGGLDHLNLQPSAAGAGNGDCHLLKVVTPRPASVLITAPVMVFD